MGNLAIDINHGPNHAATDLLAKTVVRDGMISIPVDVDLIAQRIGLEVQRMRLSDGTDGLLVKNEAYKPFKAVLDVGSGERRARFTLAHEIGHYVHKYQDHPDGELAGIVERRNSLSSQGTDPEEIWANGFAAQLLMPARIVARLWGDGWSIDAMADMFNVSSLAMGTRVTSLGLR
ncbi:ImmA/IrrE family metallo-endopeptidase [Collinsella tanakaei]|uniref:ImmA/IrrE family metallo-endopeptidase n=1 Tax=Collinsella tanakaei TaxID=626935 RepID=UPI00195F123D|nr:ImmA/IrrE family metallo-endopeptidase [Collinsella tanakaei]MBM6757030.1 ImmA/IrrE family metallo-endopeptidase [Collinsella tanakaei]